MNISRRSLLKFAALAPFAAPLLARASLTPRKEPKDWAGTVNWCYYAPVSMSWQCHKFSILSALGHANMMIRQLEPGVITHIDAGVELACILAMLPQFEPVAKNMELKGNVYIGNLYNESLSGLAERRPTFTWAVNYDDSIVGNLRGYPGMPCGFVVGKKSHVPFYIRMSDCFNFEKFQQRIDYIVRDGMTPTITHHCKLDGGIVMLEGTHEQAWKKYQEVLAKHGDVQLTAISGYEV